MKKCLACYLPLEGAGEYHERCSRRIFGSKIPPRLDHTLSEINELAQKVIEKRVAIPGVQPKLSLTFANGYSLEKRLTIVGLWNGLYVLKPPSEDYPQLPQNEDVTMHMAKLVGIKTADHSLIRFASGELAYLSKRFDRKIRRRKMVKFHQEDMCQLTGLLTENKYNSSMEKIANTVNRLTTHKGLELLALFKTTVFSFLVGNSDMHLKNFSLVHDEDGTIYLSPAYDLLSTALVFSDDKEDMALPIAGKKHKLKLDDFYAFAETCKMNPKATENVFKDLEKKLTGLKKIISISFLSDEMAQNYLDLIGERAARLNLTIPGNFQILER